MVDEEKWPHHGPDFNSWNGDLRAFMTLLTDAADESWWCMDTPLKYLEIRVDTRDCGFILLDRDRNRISPDRVVAAIASWREKFGTSKRPLPIVPPSQQDSAER